MSNQHCRRAEKVRNVMEHHLIIWVIHLVSILLQGTRRLKVMEGGKQRLAECDGFVYSGCLCVSTCVFVCVQYVCERGRGGGGAMGWGGILWRTPDTTGFSLQDPV